MANIALFQDGSALPAFLTSGADDLAKMLSGGSSGRSISIKGGTFRLVVGGEEVAKKDERFMNVIILAAQPKPGRAFYAEKYKEGVDASPACWSADGVTPSKDSDAPQCSNCMQCPQNIEGSGENNTRACRYNQRLALLLENDPNGDIYRLTLPAKSIFGKPVNGKMGLQAYAKFLQGHNAPMGGIVTKIYFDTDEAVPVVRFSGVRALSQEEYNAARAKAQSEEAKEAITVSYPKKKQETAGAALFAADTAVAAAAEAVATPEQDAEPTVRRSAKPKPAPAPAPSQSVSALLDEWAEDDAA